MPDAEGSGQVPILDFMMVRAPEAVIAAERFHHYVVDRPFVIPSTGLQTHVPEDPPDPTAIQNISAIARLVYDKVFCSGLPPGPAALDDMLTSLLAKLRPRVPECMSGTSTQGTGVGSGLTPYRLTLEDFDRHATIRYGGRYYLLPDDLDALSAMPLAAEIRRLGPIFADTAGFVDRRTLRRRVESVFANPKLYSVVYGEQGHSDRFRIANRELFDVLYQLYLLRRWTTVNFEHIIGALRMLHALEALAVDSLLDDAMAAPNGTTLMPVVAALATRFPALQGWTPKRWPDGFPLIGVPADLDALMTAAPVVHPIFARLFWYPTPFNDIKPIGVGDLKVVRQWLTAYLPGEISHIHNIMKGEVRSRDHRRLERSEETFSLTTSRAEDTTRESQTTERFEVKNETENVVNTMLNVTANANMTYNNSVAMITASAGAGFGYTRATEDHTRAAQNFARDVVSKAVERVETRVVQQRTTVLTFETEEKNHQEFSNVGGKAHVSGIYRWIDKEYTAQIFNYGKRLMFEFLVPEPAAFWVDSKIHAYEYQLEVPQPPYPEPTRKTATLPFVWNEITVDRFNQLKAQYDLRDMIYPATAKSAPLRNKQSRERTFRETGVFKSDVTRTFNSVIEGGDGYRVAAVHLFGHIEFAHQNPANRMTVLLNDRLVFTTSAAAGAWPGPWELPPDEEILLTSDDVTFTLSFGSELEDYDLSMRVDLTLPDSGLEKFQRKVYDAALLAEQKQLDSQYQELKLAFDAKLSEYHGRLMQIRAVAVQDLIAGVSEAANRLVMDEEIKKYCLTLVTREFDEDIRDDVLAQLDGMLPRDVCAPFPRLKVTETEGKPTTIAYHRTEQPTNYPSIDLNVARIKGAAVQFLEQAFEWDRISYLFYPYFWSAEPKWIELMNRSDDADSTFMAFLRAGMARVLVAVRPGYEEAVLHYLATREPWDGGPAPVIGDPLFVALHEEMRRQHDDRTGGAPEGEPWTYTVPTALVYLHGSETGLPDLAAERAART